MTLTDAGLHRKVLSELESEPGLRHEEIGVAVKGGVVTLTGFVDSYRKKRQAEHAALRVPGVEVLADRLQVQPPDQRELSDTEIAHRVADHLRWQLLFPEEKVKARVEAGWVTLEGDVELFQHKAAAEMYIRQLSGVRGVTNLITVKPPESVENIRAKVEAALGQSALRGQPDSSGES